MTETRRFTLVSPVVKPRIGATHKERKAAASAAIPRHSRGEGLVPSKEFVFLDIRDVSRLRQMIVDTSIPEPNTGCWLWLGNIGGGGRPRINYNYHGWAGSVVAWSCFNGSSPGMDVLHRCDQPLCVNPDHLFLGTHADNMRDRTEKKRHRYGDGASWSKLSEQSVREIRNESAAGASASSLSEKYGVSIWTIRSALSGENWGHVK